MTVADPVAWERVEDALHDWIVKSTGITGPNVRLQAPRKDGQARGAPLKCLITLVGAVPTSQQGRNVQPRIVQMRYTVIDVGPGEVGVDFYPAASLTPQRISIVAGVGDPPATSATALLAELVANLPAGYTASADPLDTASVLVIGAAATPLFTATTADPLLLTATTPMPRFPVVVRVEHTATWRVTIRADDVSGGNTAEALMAKAIVYRRTLLDPAMRALSFRAAGTPLSTTEVPAERGESVAVLDVAFIGLMTGAEGGVTMRAAGFTQTAA